MRRINWLLIITRSTFLFIPAISLERATQGSVSKSSPPSLEFQEDSRLLPSTTITHPKLAEILEKLDGTQGYLERAINILDSLGDPLSENEALEVFREAFYVASSPTQVLSILDTKGIPQLSSSATLGLSLSFLQSVESFNGGVSAIISHEKSQIEIIDITKLVAGAINEGRLTNTAEDRDEFHFFLEALAGRWSTASNVAATIFGISDYQIKNFWKNGGYGYLFAWSHLYNIQNNILQAKELIEFVTTKLYQGSKVDKLSNTLLMDLMRIVFPSLPLNLTKEGIKVFQVAQRTRMSSSDLSNFIVELIKIGVVNHGSKFNRYAALEFSTHSNDVSPSIGNPDRRDKLQEEDSVLNPVDALSIVKVLLRADQEQAWLPDPKNFSAADFKKFLKNPIIPLFQPRETEMILSLTVEADRVMDLFTTEQQFKTGMDFTITALNSEKLAPINLEMDLPATTSEFIRTRILIPIRIQTKKIAQQFTKLQFASLKGISYLRAPRDFENSLEFRMAFGNLPNRMGNLGVCSKKSTSPLRKGEKRINSNTSASWRACFNKNPFIFFHGKNVNKCYNQILFPLMHLKSTHLPLTPFIAKYIEEVEPICRSN